MKKWLLKKNYTNIEAFGLMAICLEAPQPWHWKGFIVWWVVLMVFFTVVGLWELTEGRKERDAS